MPGNGVGDRVHNFFPQDNLSQGQHQQIADRSWPVVGNNLWVGNPGQVGVPSSNLKSYNLPHSDVDAERGQSSLPLHSHGLNFTQSIPRPEFAQNQSQSQQLANDYMYGNRIHQTRQGQANFLAGDTSTDHYNTVSRGPSHIRSETSESPASLDLFGNQQQMNHPQTSMLQSLQRQQSGFNDMQQIQQQIMLRKLQELHARQELQRQQQIHQLDARQELQRQHQLQQLDAKQQLQRQQPLRQLDARQQNVVHSASPFGKQLAGSYPSPLINGSPSSDPLTSSPGFESGNMNWLQRASPNMEGSSNGPVYSSNLGQAHRLMDSVPQHGDQSLYGVPVSSSRSNVTQFSQITAEKPTLQHVGTFSVTGNQYTGFVEHASMQDDTLTSRNLSGHASGQALPSAMNVENLQQLNPVQRNPMLLEARGREELADQQHRAQQVSTSQNEVSLDPTEERILFGSDDNIFAAFGKSPSRTGDTCGPYDSGGSNAFSSFQSGTWSALMQSAVAETSGGDVVQQEEWSGLNLQNTAVLPGNQHMTNSGKNHTSLPHDVPSSLNSSVGPPDTISVNNNYQNVPAVHERNQSLQANYSPRLVPPSQEASRWSSPSLSEASLMHANTLQSPNTGTNLKNASVPWSAVQSRVAQQFANPNGWNTLGTVTLSGNAAPNLHESENSSRHSEGSEQKRVMQGEVVDGRFLGSSRATPAAEAEHGKSFAGSHMKRDVSNLRNAAAAPNTSIAGPNEGSSLYPFNSHQINYWKNVSPSVKAQGSGSFDMSRHLANKGNEAVDSLKRCDQVEVKKNEMENYNRKENSSDSHCSNLSRHNSAGGLKENGGPKENAFSDVSDSRSMPSGKQKAVNQVSRKNSGPRKFQYHPMGNVDEVEPSVGLKQPLQSLTMPQQTNHFQTKSYAQMPKGSVELTKEQSTDSNGAGGAPSRQSLPGHAENTTMPFNRSLDSYMPNKDSQSSQNMLELLHKVDQSGDHRSMMPFRHSGHNLSSEMPEAENSDGSEGRLQQGQSSTSQGYGLQLGPPSQRMAAPNQALFSQSSPRTPNTSFQNPPWNGEKGRIPTSSVQSLPPLREKTPGELKDVRSGLPGMVGNNAFMHKSNLSSAFGSTFPYSRGQFEHPQMDRASGQIPGNQPDTSHHAQRDSCPSSPARQTVDSSLPDAANVQNQNQNINSGSSGGISQQIVVNDDARARVSTSQVFFGEPAALQTISASSSSQQGTTSNILPNMWTNVQGQAHLLGAQFHKVSSNVPQWHQLKVLESTPYVNQKQGEQDGQHIPSLGKSSMNKESPMQQLSTRGTSMIHKTDEPQGPESLNKNMSDGSPANSASMQQDLEAFGRSLKSNKLFHQNYSLLNQMQAMKSSESDPNVNTLKKLRGSESSLEGQQVAPKAVQSSDNSATVRDESSHPSAVTSGDSKILSFSGPPDNAEGNTSIQQGNLTLQNLGQDDNRNNPYLNNSVSVRVERSQISPQMAPSWFNQYGTFRNGQIISMHDAHKTSMTGIVEQPPSSLGMSTGGLRTLEQGHAAVDTSQIGNIQTSSAPVSGLIEHISLPQAPTMNISRPEKRKRPISCLSPWHKVVSQGSLSLQTISVAEAHWAKVANSIPEKIEDEVELMDDGSHLLRAKRRLTLTTQLMQQLLRPPEPAIFTADSHYESVAFYLSRLALGDACGLVSYQRSDHDTSDVVSQSSDKFIKIQRVDGEHHVKVIEGFMERARKLETDFSRTDKRASLVDLRVECQELEKFSVINRFAKFHGRGQSESSDTSLSSDGAANAALKPCLQRYVTALPVSRNLPDRVQCLSL